MKWICNICQYSSIFISHSAASCNGMSGLIVWGVASLAPGEVIAAHCWALLALQFMNPIEYCSKRRDWRLVKMHKGLFKAFKLTHFRYLSSRAKMINWGSCILTPDIHFIKPDIWNKSLEKNKNVEGLCFNLFLFKLCIFIIFIFDSPGFYGPSSMRWWEYVHIHGEKKYIYIFFFLNKNIVQRSKLNKNMSFGADVVYMAKK